MIKKCVSSICISESPKRIPRKGMMLGRQIRQGLIDGVSDDCSQLLRNCFDKEHGVVDPYFSFGNSTIGEDKFQRAVISSKQQQNLKDQTKSTDPAASASEPAASASEPSITQSKTE